MRHTSPRRIPTHRRGEKFDLLDMDIVIPETCLADKIWNYLWKEGRLSTYYIRMTFSQHKGDLVNRACMQLIDEGRACLSPARKFMYAECKEPPGWFDKTWQQVTKFDR